MEHTGSRKATFNEVASTGFSRQSSVNSSFSVEEEASNIEEKFLNFEKEIKREMKDLKENFERTTIDKEDNKIKSTGSGIIENVSCHGLQCVFSPQIHYVRRLVWAVALLCSTAGYGYLAYLAISRYLSNPSSSVYEVVTEDSLKFPSVTVCHSGKLRKSYADAHGLTSDFPAMYSPIPFLKALRSVPLEITGYGNNTLTDIGLSFYLEKTGLFGLLDNITKQVETNPASNKSVIDYVREAIDEAWTEKKKLNDNFAFLDYLEKTGLLDNITKHIETDPASNKSVIDYVREAISQGLTEINLNDNFAFLDEDIIRDEKYVTKEEYARIYAEFSSYKYNLSIEKVFSEGGYDASRLIAACFTFGDRTVESVCKIDTYIDATGYGQCHSVTAIDTKTLLPAESRRYGNAYFGLWFAIEEEEFLPTEFENEPYILVKVHQTGTYVDMANGYDLVINKNAVLLVVLEQSMRVNIPAPYTRCVDTDDPDFVNPLRSLPYSRDACVKECENSFVMKNFGCNLPNFPGDNYTACRVGEFDDLTMLTDPPSCDHCEPPCRLITYETTAVQELISWFPGFSAVGIRFKDHSYPVVTQTVAYPAEAVFGDLGGNLGLMLGASLLTVLELVEALVMLLWSRLWHAK